MMNEFNLRSDTDRTCGQARRPSSEPVSRQRASWPHPASAPSPRPRIYSLRRTPSRPT